MKNSPHRNKHLQRKALREARHIELWTEKASKTPPTTSKTNLKRLNVKRCADILNVYKNHLEHARLYKSAHHSKRTTPGEVEGSGPYTINPNKNPKRITAHWQASDLERSKKVARKMLKQPHEEYKKAA